MRFQPFSLGLLTVVLSLCLGAGCSGGPKSSDSGTSQNTDGGGGGPSDGGGPVPSDASSPPTGDGSVAGAIQTVFVIVMENHNWSDIQGSSDAPYINSLLTTGVYADQYFNPPGNHPSEPNYLWIEAGTNFGITNDDDPSVNHQSTTDHLVSQLETAGISWKSYQEDISGSDCPLSGSGLYAPKHNPMVYFDDITNGNSSTSTHCKSHVRPYSELAGDLSGGTVARYNFLTPNLCDDMHNDTGCGSGTSIAHGDTWLSEQLPMIMASDAYMNGGVIFITWDESEGGDFPIGMIILSPLAKAGGYHNSTHYTHSSLLRTVETIFGVPFLRAAQSSNDLGDFFTTFP